MTAPTTAPGRLGACRIVAEASPGPTIADPTTYWASGAKDVRGWDFDTSKMAYESIDDPAAVSNSFEDRTKILTAQKPILSWKQHLVGLNQTAADTTAVTQEQLGLLLKSAMGGQILGTTTKAGAASGVGATADLVVASSAGLTVGGAVCVNGEARRITAIADATHVTLDMDLSAAPAQNDLIIAAATYYIDESALVDMADAGHITLAALFQGYQSDDQWQLRGGFPEFTIADLGPRKIPSLAVMLYGMAFEQGALSVAAFGSFTSPTPPSAIAAYLYMQTQGTVTRNVYHVKDVAIAPGLKAAEQPSPGAEQGIAGHIVVGGRATLEFDAFYTDSWRSAYEARTLKYGGCQLGKPTSAHGAVLVTFPELSIDESPGASRPKDNAITQRVKMHANQYLSGATDAAKSRIGIHLFPHT